MQVRGSFRRFPAQPIVAALAILFALVLGLFAGYAAARINTGLAPSYASTSATTNGPDAQERNAELRMRQLSKDDTHGH